MLRKTDQFRVRSDDGEEIQILEYRLDAGSDLQGTANADREFRTEDGEAVSRITDTVYRVLASGRHFRRLK